MAEHPMVEAGKDLLPEKPVDVLVGPLRRFLHIQAASGVVLMVVTAIALWLANSPWSEPFVNFWRTTVGARFGDYELTNSLKHWINDGVMVLFFFVIGLEVKREIVLGELRDLKTAALPLAAALGGMVAPAALFLLLQWDQPTRRGWGIPMATDIAFVVGCLALLGSRVPHSFRVLLLTLAIADDIGAILVIAIGYSGTLNLTALGLGALGIAVVLLFQRLDVRSVPVYTVVGLAIWLAFHESGIHATIAGVVLGLLTPARPWVDHGRLQEITAWFSRAWSGGPRPGRHDELAGEKDGKEVPQKDAASLRSMELAAREARAPLERLETMLHPWVGFVIMPLFALANAGVPIAPGAFREGVTIAVMVGLALGKPLGIVAFSALAVKLGLAALPEGVNWRVMTAGGVLAGIGFTMALFIAALALEGPALDAAKVGILAASALCAVVGMVSLFILLPSRKKREAREKATATA